MKKFFLCVLAFSTLIIAGCDSSSSTSATGTLQVTSTLGSGMEFLHMDGTTQIPYVYGDVDVADPSYTTGFPGGYPGYPGTGKIHVFVYASTTDFSASKARTAPDYTAQIATDGGTVTISGIAPGDYYVMTMYDYKGGESSVTACQSEAYSFYGTDGMKGSPLSASLVTITAGDTNVITANIDNKDRKFAGDISGTYFQNTLTVNCTLNVGAYSFGATDAATAGTGKIHVFAWDPIDGSDNWVSLGANRVRKYSGVISANGGKVVLDIPISESALTVLAMYDYKNDTGSYGIAGENEYYEFYTTGYNDTTSTAVSVTGISNESINITIDAYQFSLDTAPEPDRISWDVTP